MGPLNKRLPLLPETHITRWNRMFQFLSFFPLKVCWRCLVFWVLLIVFVFFIFPPVSLFSLPLFSPSQFSKASTSFIFLYVSFPSTLTHLLPLWMSLLLICSSKGTMCSSDGVSFGEPWMVSTCFRTVWRRWDQCSSCHVLLPYRASCCLNTPRYA